MPLDPPYVDLLGVLQVRHLYDDHKKALPPVDMLHLQEELDFLPEDYCSKDRYSGVQRIFYCLVCDCDVRSVQTLDSHVAGQKHVRKSLEKKRREWGVLAPAPHAPTKGKRRRTPPPRVDARVKLVDRLKDEEEQPALGLEYIAEYINPSHPSDLRMYSCTLQGCKSAWGDSDSMAKHLIGKQLKHNRNFLRFVAKIPAASSMTKNELLEASLEYDRVQRGSGEPRNYKAILQVRDQARYDELKNRSPDWSEAKSKFSGSEFGNSNMEPLGTKKRKMGRTKRETSNVEKAEKMIEELDNLHTRIEDNLEKIQTGQRSLKKVTTEAMKQYKFCVKTFEKNQNMYLVEKDFRNIKESIPQLESFFESVMDSEVRAIKKFESQLELLKGEVNKFVGSADDDSYNDLKQRLSNVSNSLVVFDPEDAAHKVSQSEMIKLCQKLQESLSSQGADISSLLEREMAKSSTSAGVKQKAIDEYNTAMGQHVKVTLYSYFKNINKPGNIRIATLEEFETHVKDITGKVSGAEIAAFEKSGHSWEHFRLSSHTKSNVAKYIGKKMAGLPPVL